MGAICSYPIVESLEKASKEHTTKLRRDSPTCSPLGQHMVCHVAASEGLEAYIADAKGAFIQGKKIGGDVFF